MYEVKWVLARLWTVGGGKKNQLDGDVQECWGSLRPLDLGEQEWGDLKVFKVKRTAISLHILTNGKGKS